MTGAPIHDAPVQGLSALGAGDSHEKLMLHFEQTLTAVIEWDLSFRVTRWNLAAQRMFGYTPDEALGRHASFIVPAELLPHIDEIWQGLVRQKGGRRSTNDNVRKDGESIVCDWYNTPIIDVRGVCTAVVSLVQDVTERTRAEAALRTATRLLERTGELAKIGGWEVDLKSMKLSWTLETFRIAEIDPPNEPPLSDVVELFAAEARPTISAAVQALIDHGTPYDLVLPLITAKGRRRVVQTQGFPKFRDDKVVRIYGTFQDITARVQQEEQARANAQRFDDLVNSVGGIVWEANADPFTFTTVSRSAERLLGYPQAEWMEPGFWIRHAHPTDQQAVLASATRGEDFDREYRFVAADGRVVWLRDIVRSVTEVGQPRRLRGLTVDITAQKAAEEALRVSDAALKSISHGVLLSGPDRLIVSANAAFCQITGFDESDMIGRNCNLLQGPRSDPATIQGMKRALQAQTDFQGEIINYRKDGREFRNDVRISPVHDLQGQLTGFVGISRDITEQKRAEADRLSLEAQLRESQKMEAVGTLAGGIAHDFNNALTAILGNTRLALDDAVNNASLLESLNEIDRAAMHARDLVRQILSFSRRQPTNRQRLSLGGVVEDAARLLRATLSSRYTITLKGTADGPTVMADATQIEQVVINLVTNAMQAMPDGYGRIDITVDSVMLDESLAEQSPPLRALYDGRPTRMARLSVRDYGRGMDTPTLLRIFEPFYTTKPVGEGTGLGLAVVHGIVQGHVGAMVVESTPGQGSTFTFFLPAEVEPSLDDVSADDLSARKASPNVLRGRHVLFLDDEQAIVSLGVRLLQRRGYRTTGFMSHREALAALRRDPTAYDLVLTDYNMPGMSGLDVAREVVAIRADLPVAITTGFVDDLLRTTATAVGVCEIVAKPLGVDEFYATIERLLRTGGQLRQP